MASLRKLFGKRLRYLRTEKGFNQLYLATLASVSEDFISLVERGINQPSFETIEALAVALETDVTTLFTFPEIPERTAGRDKKTAEEKNSRKAAIKGSPTKRRKA